MRKIFFILTILFVSVTCFSQSIVPRANSSYTVQDSRFKAALNLFVPTYSDTTAANAGTAEGIDSLGAVIYTYDVQALWVRRYDSGKKWAAIGGGGGGSGTVTSVGWTGGIVSIANPTTTPAFTIAGTSGGIPYFSSSSTWATSAALAANSLIVGGGAGSAPSSITTGTGILTALGVNIGSAGAPVLFNGAGGTPSSITLTNGTNLPIIAGTTGTLTIARGGTNLTALGTALQQLRVNAGSTALEYFTPASPTVPGIDDVLAVGQSLSADRTITIGGNDLLFINSGVGTFKVNDGTFDLLAITPTEATLFNSDGTGFARFSAQGGVANPVFDIIASEGEGSGHAVNILGNASTGLIEYHTWGTHEFVGDLITYTADTHTITGDIIGQSPTFDIRFLIDHTNDSYYIGNITTHGIDIAGATNLISYTATTHSVTGLFRPATDDTYALGDDTHRWSDIFLGPASIHIGTSTSDEGLLSYNTTTNVLALTSTGAISVNKVTITAPATSSTLTVADGSSLITSGAFALTLTSTATSNATIPAGTNTLYSTLSGSITSSQLATSITNETGSGSLVFGTAPSMSSITLAAGTATAATAPMYFTSGTNLTATVSGAVEFDGNTFYKSTASGRGYNPSVMFGALSSDFTMSDVNTVQPTFPTGFDVWTLQGSVSYFFEGTYILTHNATSHSLGMSFELSGGASVTSISYTALVWATAIGTTTASQNTTNINVTTNTAVNSAGANAIETVTFSGIIRMNAGGTVQPSITFSAAPGGTCLARVGTYIRFTPIGTSSITNVGNVN